MRNFSIKSHFSCVERGCRIFGTRFLLDPEECKSGAEEVSGICWGSTENGESSVNLPEEDGLAGGTPAAISCDSNSKTLDLCFANSRANLRAFSIICESNTWIRAFLASTFRNKKRRVCEEML